MLKVLESKTADYLTKVLIFLILFISFLALPYGTGDTAELVSSSLTFRECLISGMSTCSGMERFGFTPHLISFFLWSIFKDINATISAWSFLNFVLYCIIIYYFFSQIRNNKFIKLSILIFSPIPAYAVYSYSEMSYIFLIFVVILSLKKNNYLISSLLAILLSAYKETSILLIFPIIFAGLFYENLKFNLRKILVLTSSFLGFLLVYLFNYYKYGQFINNEYQTAGRVTEPNLLLSNFFGIWFSPTGGIIGVFWFSIVAFLFIHFKQNFNSKKFILNNLILLFTIFINWIMLTFWFSPFGWVTWGPRLFMPTLFACFIFILIFYQQQILEFNVFSRILIAIGSFLSILNVLGFLKNSESFKIWLESVIYFLPNCPKLFVWEIERIQYIKCFTSMTWELNSLNLITIKSYFMSVLEFNLNSIILILILFLSIVRNVLFIKTSK